MSDLRKNIDNIKKIFRSRISDQPGYVFQSDMLVRIISQVLHNHLRNHRRDPWRSPDICAVYEMSVENDCLPTFDGIWNQVEVRGEFKCSTVEMPEELIGRQILRRMD